MSLKDDFKNFSEELLKHLESEEHLTMSFTGEESQFYRYSQAKIRQATSVDQFFVSLNFIRDAKNLTAQIMFTEDHKANLEKALQFLKEARRNTEYLCPSVACVVPKKASENIMVTKTGEPLVGSVQKDILSSVSSLDFVGLLTAGKALRGFSDSAGNFHWFESNNFYLDYSIYTPQQKSVKGCYANQNWSKDEFSKSIAVAQEHLKNLNKSEIEVPRGKHRTYLTPSAVGEVISLLSWGALSGQSYKQGGCAFKKLYDQEVALSPHFHLLENFDLGLTPAFNSYGEVSPSQVELIKGGKIQNLLVSAATAQEYPDLDSNFASDREGLRSPEVLAGDLDENNILEELGTGLYVSNLHYLNWSDRMFARVTGTTRFACFWVEEGQIKGPIKDLRFDESLFNILGEQLQGLTQGREVIPQVETYHHRSLGGMKVPGALVNKMAYTL